MSLFVRVDVGFWTHRKTMRLRAIIGEMAFWLPPRLWSYAAQNQPDGNFSDYQPSELALLVGCSMEGEAMLQALQSSGFMDGMKIHDWAEHNGYHEKYAIRAKKAAKARWSKPRSVPEKTVHERRQALLVEDVSIATSNATSIPTLKTRGAQADILSLCTELGLTQKDAVWFFQKCEGNGWTNGGKPIKDWKATVRSWNAAEYFPSQKINGSAVVSKAPVFETDEMRQIAQLKASGQL